MNTNECLRARQGRATLLIFLLAILVAACSSLACSNPEKAKA